MKRLSEDASEKTPRISDFPKPIFDRSKMLSEPGAQANKSEPTTASNVFQKGLTPLVIPAKVVTSNAASSQNSLALDEEGDKPPQVPPKSPRTESRASPRIRQLPHSASSSTSTTRSACSSATSASSTCGKPSPRSQQHSHNEELSQEKPTLSLDGSDGKFPGSHLKHLERVGRQTPPRVGSPVILPNKLEGNSTIGPWAGLDQIGRKSPSRADSPTIQQHEQDDTRGTHPSGKPCTPHNQEQVVGEMDVAEEIQSGKGAWHQRDISETSLIDRGRPMKRGDTSLMGTLSRPNLINLKLTEENVELPSGSIAKDAPKVMHNTDLELLKKEAELKVESFEVLSARDVSNLSKVGQLLFGK